PSSGLTPAQAAQVFVESPEYLTALVGKFYTWYLNRAASPAETDLWAGALARGMTYEQAIIGFLNSPEFFANQGGTSEGFVQGLYQKLLHRAAVAAWLQVLGQGLTREQVIGGFQTSPEFPVAYGNSGNSGEGFGGLLPVGVGIEWSSDMATGSSICVVV